MALKRIVVQLDENLVEQIEQYSKRMGVNRTAGVSVLVSKALEQDKSDNSIDVMTGVIELIKKEKGK